MISQQYGITFVILAISIYILYSQYQQNKMIGIENNYYKNFMKFKHKLRRRDEEDYEKPRMEDHHHYHMAPHNAEEKCPRPNIDLFYGDEIKTNDLMTMYDPLNYPQTRLPRSVLEQYQDYYDKHNKFPPFYQPTKNIIDNPILNGVLIKQFSDNDPLDMNTDVPGSVPLFRVRSTKNTNRYFYYILDQRYLSRVELKIPLEDVIINGTKYSNSEFYGTPEIFDDDIVENISIYPNAKFKVQLYKNYSFP